MNKLRALAVAAATLCGVAVFATDEPETTLINLGGTDYEATLLEKRDIGPGTTWRRLRIPAYPLNVNLVTMDMTHGYNRVETFQGKDAIGSTESIVTAAGRLSTDNHKAVAAANGNFWCVSGQEPWSDLLVGTTFGGNMRNGKIITETNNASDQWCGTPLQTCVIGADASRLWIEPLVWRGYIANEKIGYLDYQQVNKVVRNGEIGLYNSWYPAGKQFQPVETYDSNGKNHFRPVDGVSTEVYLSFPEGSGWATGTEFEATVTKVNTAAGRGTLGSSDICLVGQGDKAEALAKLVPGDVLRIYTGWTSFQTWETPALENVMQGLALVLNDGEIDPVTNQQNSYNNQIYPKTGYGCDKDNTTLYIITIDKSIDPVYGSSAGCPSWVMCDILKHYGCWRAAAVDAGGSTEMFITDRIVNKTTESAPRAVANGWMVFDTAPQDAEIVRLEFDDVAIRVPVYCQASPKVLGYNKYGTLIDDDVQGIAYTCDANVGTCTDGVFVAGAEAAKGTLTATLNGVSVTKAVEVVDAQVALRLHDIVIDHVRRYPVEVVAPVGDKTFVYDPTALNWDSSDNDIATIGTDGVLTGVKNGQITLTGTIGAFSDKANVSVEIPESEYLEIQGEDWVAADWKATGTSTKNFAITHTEGSAAMGVDFQISSTRAPKVTVAKDIRLFGLPDALCFEIAPGTATVKEVTLSVQSPTMARAESVTLPFDAESGKAKFDLADFGDTTDIGFYPVTFKSLALSLGGSTGTYHIDIPAMQAQYANYRTNGVDEIGADASEGMTVNAPAEYYTLQGVRVSPANLTAGLYIVRRGATASKILIR